MLFLCWRFLVTTVVLPIQVRSLMKHRQMHTCTFTACLHEVNCKFLQNSLWQQQHIRYRYRSNSLFKIMCLPNKRVKTKVPTNEPLHFPFNQSVPHLKICLPFGSFNCYCKIQQGFTSYSPFRMLWAASSGTCKCSMIAPLFCSPCSIRSLNTWVVWVMTLRDLIRDSGSGCMGACSSHLAWPAPKQWTPKVQMQWLLEMWRNCLQK